MAKRNNDDCDAARDLSRRRFVSLAGWTGAGLLAPVWATAQQRDASKPAQPKASGEEEDVSPPEDLMREHGVLKRILLVYDEAIRRIDTKQDLAPEPIRESARIIRTFIEDYHEKLEEDYLFPRFEKAATLTDLTMVLRAQHQAGRRVTERIGQLATPQSIKVASSAAQLKDLMHQFVRMYAPHEAREDTVLFPALRGIVSKQEFGALGEEFEKKERALFGEDGFEMMVDRVASIEKALGIYDLSQFTPEA